MNKRQIIRIGKKFKLHLIKRQFIYLKQYLFLSRKYGLFSGGLVSFNDLNPLDILYSREVTLFHSPPVFEDGNLQDLVSGMKYTQYAVHLKNAAVLGYSNLIVLSNDKVLYDLPFYDVESRYFYTDYKIIKIKDKKITYWKGKEQTIDKAIWMGGNYSWNFYHLIYEFSIKFRKLSELHIPSDVPVLIDQKWLNIPQFKELLDIVNEKGYPLMGVMDDAFFKVNELFYSNCPNFIPPNNKDDNDGRSSDIQFDIESIKDLRRFLLPYASRQNFPEKIFISRKNASDRRQFNEEELIQLSVEFGFEIVYPEKLSFREQIGLFSQAEWIVGGSGAAFANLLFCKNQSKAIIFSKTQVPFSGFSTIARTVGVDLRYISEEKAGQKIKMKNIHDAFQINVSDFKKCLSE